MSTQRSLDQRILHVIHGLTIGGTEVDLVNKAIVLTHDYGYDVTICCLMRRGQLASRAENAGIRVVGPFMRHRYDVLAGCQLRRLFLAEPWSFVHTHLFAANLIGVATLVTVPPSRRPLLVVAEHAMADCWSRLVLFTYRWLQDYFALILVPSRASAASYIARGVRKSQLQVMPNAIDIHRFSQVDRASSRLQLRQLLHIPQDAYLVGTVCRLEIVKGLPTLLAAIEKLPVHLVIAGEGPERVHLTSIIGAKGLDNRVQLLGSWTDVPELLAALDLFVLPSYSESFGITVAESLLMERPVVATGVGGISEITGGGRYARLVPPGDASALAEAIQWVVDHPEEAQVQARQGRAFVNQTFALEVVAEQQHEIYRQLLAQR